MAYFEKFSNISYDPVGDKNYKIIKDSSVEFYYKIYNFLCRCFCISESKLINWYTRNYINKIKNASFNKSNEIFNKNEFSSRMRKNYK